MSKERRFRQRFQNFEKARVVFLRRIDEYEAHPDEEAYQMALIQAFEIVQELGWRTLRDYLDSVGYDDLENAKKTIKKGFQDGIIANAEGWMTAIEKRNRTSHIYDEKLLAETTGFIRADFYPLLNDLYHQLKQEL